MGLPRTQLGRFELLIDLGRGGMAELSVGRFLGVAGFTKLVAIKRMLPHLAHDPAFVEQFGNEGRIAGRLSHPNICQLFELCHERGELYLVMEYLEGAAWNELLAALPGSDPVRVPLTAGVIAQAAEGLGHAHELHDLAGNPTPVIHRDVSPHNLFVTTDGVCKVLDFGVAKVATEGPRTRTGVLKGKLPYMSPEQIAGEPLDRRSDVFALAVVAWEALAGARLFDRDTDFLIWKAIIEEPIPTLTSRRPALPAALDGVLARALERDRSRRYPTTRDFAVALAAAAGGAFAPPQIANVLRTACAAQIAGRAALIREACRDHTHDVTAAATLRDPADSASVQMRRDAFAIERDDAARRESIAVECDDAARREATTLRPGDHPAVRGPVDRASLRARDAPGPRRSRLWLWLPIVGVAGIAIGAVAMRGGGAARSTAAPDAPTARARGDQLRVAFDVVRDLERVRDGSGDGLARLQELAEVGQHAHGELAPAGTYDVTSELEARIFVDDRYVDTTPLHTVLPVGLHHVRAVLPDGRAQAFDVTIVADERAVRALAW